MKKLFLTLLVLLLTFPMISHTQEITPQTPDEICADATPATEPSTRQFSQPEQVLETGVDYRAIFCTEAGAIYIDLFETLAPYTVNSFVFLAQSGYYNNTTFHRVLENFMAQGGDHTGTGAGSPGYNVRDEYVAYMIFDRPGLLATANSNDRQQGRVNTNGSQFFITTVPTTWLNYNHSIFGEVLVGQDVVLNLRLRDPQTATTPGAALNTVVIITDPTALSSSYEPPVPANQQDFEAIITNFEPLEGVEVDTQNTGVFSTEDTIVRLPESIQAEAETFFTTHNHQFTATITHANMTCDFTNLPVVSVRKLIYVFSSKADAVAAQADEAFLSILTEGNGVQSQTASEYYELPIYSWSATACNVPSTQSRMVRQLGRMLIITENISPADAQIEIETWMDNLVANLYDVLFESVFRPEANQ